MEVNERASYLKGLAEGLELDNTKPEHKIISALIDAVGEISEELQQIRSYLVDLSEDIEMLDQEMELIWDETEDLLIDESEDKGCGHDCCCGDD